MNLLKAMRCFSIIADQESFSGAARILRQSPPSITRDLALLEQHLGCQLLIRTTRQMRLTAEGKAYLEDVRRILADLSEAEANVRGARGRIEGSISLTAPALFGRHHVAPVALDFARQHNGIRLIFTLSDRVVDLVDEGIDIAIRIGSLPDSSLHAIRVGTVQRVLCASPGYLEQFGTPSTAADLVRHRMIEIFGATSMPPPAADSGTTLKPEMAAVVANSVDVALMAAEQGFGVVRALSYQVEEAVGSGRLRIIVPMSDSEPVPVSILHAAGRRTPRRLRAMIDFLADGLRQRIECLSADLASPTDDTLVQPQISATGYSKPPAEASPLRRSPNAQSGSQADKVGRKDSRPSGASYPGTQKRSH